VVAPCALGGVIDQVNVGRLRARIVCGAANNILAHEGLADDMAAQGILYAPDFIANAGGLINVSLELDGYDPAKARAGAAGIEQTMRNLLDEAEVASITPLAAAYQLARRRLTAAR
jgi:glutamate dehydrogenase/leucine dehydrogenase